MPARSPLGSVKNLDSNPGPKLEVLFHSTVPKNLFFDSTQTRLQGTGQPDKV